MAHYWFRRKRPGYGARPHSCQGWLVTVLVVAALVGVLLTGAVIRDNYLRPIWLLLGFAVIGVGLAWVSHFKTDNGHDRNP